MPRSKDYDPRGKQHLLDAGVNKEKQYILNWMREEYGKGNVSEGIWIALANHIEQTNKNRPPKAKDKFLALVEKWG